MLITLQTVTYKTGHHCPFLSPTVNHEFVIVLFVDRHQRITFMRST